MAIYGVDIDTGTDIWLKGVTEDGNGLLHMVAFLACNEDDDQDETVLGNVVYAYKFLELVLQLDPFLVKWYSSNGGTGLHIAIAATSYGSLNAPPTSKPYAFTVI